MEDKVYKSKVGLGFVILFAAMIGSALRTWWFDYQGQGLDDLLIHIGSLLVYLLLLFVVVKLFLWPCEYRFTQDALAITCGKFSDESIPYQEITNWSKSTNPSVAPALSFVRVKVIYDEGSVLISPQNRDEFISELAKRVLDCRIGESRV